MKEFEAKNVSTLLSTYYYAMWALCIITIFGGLSMGQIAYTNDFKQESVYYTILGIALALILASAFCYKLAVKFGEYKKIAAQSRRNHLTISEDSISCFMGVLFNNNNGLKANQPKHQLLIPWHSVEKLSADRYRTSDSGSSPFIRLECTNNKKIDLNLTYFAREERKPIVDAVDHFYQGEKHINEKLFK